MSEIENIKSFHDDLVAWRRDLHAHPEMAYQENRTSAFVVEKLRSWGIDVHTGLAKTGVVGTLRNGSGNRAVGLRADMDALPLQELNSFGHRSKHDGVMHACGHDGHTVMLLGAARHLAKHRDFDGTVHLIFQPAEEGEAGGKLMIEEGLFEKFPCNAVYGLHNLPGIPVGKFAVRSGPLLASADRFEIKVIGSGSHGAFPHQGVDPIVVASELVLALQSIVTRNIDPLQSAVISVAMIHGGSAHNIIPGEVQLAGTARAFTPEVRALIKQRMHQVVEGVCATHNAKGVLDYQNGYPPTINSADEADLATVAAAKVVGKDNVLLNNPPSMAADDVAYMLEACSGAHVLIGNGVGPGVGEGGCAVHNPHYDFNDKILSLGASFWVRMAETFLAKQ